MFLFTILFNVVMGLGIFTTNTIPGGAQLGDDSSGMVESATVASQYTSGFITDNLWSVVLIGSLVGVGLAILTRDTSIIGVYIFCFVFWSAYVNLFSILYIGGFLSGGMWSFALAGTGGMIFIFMAAVAGMLGGSG